MTFSIIEDKRALAAAPDTSAARADHLRHHSDTLADASEINQLYEALGSICAVDHPRTARLIAAGRSKAAQKLVEEAAEVALAAARRRSEAVVRESADLMYQLVVLWRRCGITPDAVWGEMRQRADRLGLAEKLPKVLPERSTPKGAL